MAKMRRVDSKAAFARQRAEMKRGARGKMHVGDDTGAAAGRAAEREKVHRMQELQHEQQAHRREAEDRRQALALSEQRRNGERHQERLREPILALFGELLTDSFRLARTFVLLPLRIAWALRDHRASASEA